MTNKITLYTTHCPKCKILKQKLDSTNIKYETFDDIDKMISIGITNVPILKVEETLFNFSNALKWIEAQKEVMND